MSRTKFFSKVYEGSQESQRLQTNIQSALTSILRNPLLDGRLVEDVELVTGSNKLEHKLERAVRGYILVRQNAAANLYEVSSDDLFITLSSSADVTASIWIF
jgi:hypothetical protein